MSNWPRVIAVAAAPDSVNHALFSLGEDELPEDFTGALCFARGEDRALLVPDAAFEAVDELAETLSARLEAPALAVTMLEETVWRYAFYVRGGILDCFVNWPQEEELDAGGDAAALAEHWPGAKAELLAPYLVDHRRFAHVELAVPTWPDDEFPRWSGWQFADFLRRLGLPYPEADEEPLGDWRPA